MTLNWITEPLAIYGAVAASSAAALHLFLSGRIDARRLAVAHERRVGELQDSIGRLESRVSGLVADAEAEARSRAAVAAPVLRGLNAQKRSEALRMCRRGADAALIASRLGLSRAEAVLLLKVHRTLEDAPAGQSSGSFQSRSKVCEYSLEA